MLSRNNSKLIFENMCERNTKYAIKKFSAGVASVAIGTTLFFSGAQAVQAETLTSDNTVTESSTPEEEAAAAVTPVAASVASAEDSETVEAHNALASEGFEAIVREENPVYEGVSSSDLEEVQLNLIAEGERQTNFNRNWRISNGNVVGGEATDLDVSNWRLIDLPNDFSIEKEISTVYDAESGFYPGGVQWYRKNFVLSQENLDKELSLTFDGSYMVTEVYVNGNKVGEHKNGYSPFNIKITDYLNRDGVSENHIALKVTNETPSSRWYSGSGVYRDVHLVVTDKIHVAHNGVTITTPNLKDQANGNVSVNIAANIENNSQANQLISIVNELINAQGEKVAQSQAVTTTINAGASSKVDSVLTVENPTLWGLDNPYLYKVKTIVSVDGVTKDTYESDFGFRYFNFDRNTGFSLNGQNIKLKGVNNHHDNGALGAVANRDAIKRQLELLKEMGANSIRTSHNPTSRALLDEANRQGFLIIEEAFDGWDRYKNGNTKDFARFFNEQLGVNANNLSNATADMTWAEYSLKSMINRGKNDPSIIMWSIGNEIDEGASGNTSHFGQLARTIVGWVTEADPTRPVTNGNNRIGSLDAVNQAIADAGGIIGYNYKDATTMKRQLDAHPDWIIYSSETTSAVHSRGEYGTLGRRDDTLQLSEYDNDHARVGWGASASKAWKWVVENDWNGGIYVWTGFDYIGEPTPWNGVSAGSVSGRGAVPNSSYFGILDTAGFPKDTYWLYRSMWNEDDYTLSLMSTWNNNEIVKQNGKVQVDVFTNAHRVELYLNDQKIGEATSTKTTTQAGHTYRRFTNDNPYPTFMVDWEEGTLSVRAFDEDGQEITDQAQGRKSVTTSYEAVGLRTRTKQTSIEADGSSLSYIEVDVVDRNDNIVTGSSANIQFEITGPGKIVGVDNGNAADGSSYKGDNRNAFHGKALVIVQSNREPGTITLTAKSNGLRSATQTVEVTRPQTDDAVFAEGALVAKNYTVTAGQSFDLPSQVEVLYSNGEKRSTDITWQALTPEQLNTPGSYDIVGNVQGQSTPISVRVTVIKPLVAVENYSTQTTRRVAPTLPKFLKAFDVEGNKSYDTAIDWDLRNVSFNRQGEVAVFGTTQLFGETVTVKALVEVLEEATQPENLLRKSGEPVTVLNGYRIGDQVTELTTAISDSLANLNNGVKNNGAQEVERWTNWSLRNRADIEEFYVQFNWTNEHTFANINLWHFTDNAFSRLPGEGNVRFEYWDDNASQWVTQESSNITQVSYLEGVTPYGLISPVTTSKLRVWLKQAEPGKSVGLTEVEVLSHVESTPKSQVAEITSAKLGNKLINFDQNDYAEFNSESDLQLSVKTKENGSATLVPLNDLTYYLVVNSEDGTFSRTYVLRKSPVAPLHENEVINRELPPEEFLDGTQELDHVFNATMQHDQAAIEAAMASPEYLQTEYTIYPTVQNSVYGEGVVRLDQGINIVLGDNVDIYTRNRLKEVMQTHNVSYTTSLEAVEGKYNVFVGISGQRSQAEEHQRNSVIKNDLFDEIDAYRLVVNESGISVLGKDTDSVFFGLTTLKHMMNHNELPVLRSVTVEDYANLKDRGFIEGYYGNPWSNEDRKELMKFGGDLKMTQYFFAPKDDEYHNSRWRDLYPAEELEAIRELARVGNETKNRFVWTLHPFMHNRIDFRTDESYARDLQVIKDKFTQLMDAGVREFGILADDAALPAGGFESYNRLMHDLTDWLEEQQSQYAGLRKEMIFVPQEYWGDGDEAELRSLNKNLPESSPLVLTGGRIWGEVSQDFLSRLRANLTAQGDTYRPVSMWVNWPVTDNSKEHLILGGGETFLHPNVDPSLLHGIMLNPMQQSEPSKIALFSGAEYAWNIWNSVNKAHEVNDMAFAFAETGTFKPTEESEAFRELGKHMINQNMDSRVTALQESIELAPKLQAFLDKFHAGQDISAERDELRQEFAKLKEAAQLYKESGHERMKEQIIYWLDNTIDQMDALAHLLDATEALENNDETGLWENFNKGQLRYEDSKQHKFWYVNHYEKAELGVQHIRPFMLSLISDLSSEVDKLMNPEEVVLTYISNRPDKAADTSLALDKDPTTQILYKSPSTIQEGEYVGVMFNKVIDLDSFVFNMGAISNPRDTFTRANLEYMDEDGNWQVIDGHNFVGNETLIKLSDLGLKAKGVRLIATETRTNTWLGVKDILINEDYPETSGAVDARVEVGGGLKFTYGTTATQMIDGNNSTESMFKNTNNEDNVPAGGWVQLTLPEAQTITKVKLIQGSSDKLSNGVLEYSVDGENWTTLEHLTGQQSSEITTPFVAKYVRVKNNETINKWLRIAEFTLESQTGTKEFTQSNNDDLKETLTNRTEDGFHLDISQDGVLKPNEYVGLKLDKIYGLNEIENLLTNDQLTVYYSPNEVEWYPASQLDQEDVYYARYIRVVNETNQGQTTSGNGIHVKVKAIKAPSLEETNFGISTAYGANDVRNINNLGDLFDGQFNRHVEFADTPQTGSNFVINLGQPRDIRKIRAYIQDGTTNYLRDGKIQVSEDGQNWTDVVTVGDGVENTQGADQSITDGYIHDSNNPGNRYIEGELDQPVKANFIRVIATAPYRHRFVSFTEFVINDGEFAKDYIDEDVVTNALEAQGLDSANLIDKRVLTKFAPQANQGEFTYRLSEKTKANHVRLISNIPNGASVKAYAKVVVNNGSTDDYTANQETRWVELGAVDNSFKTFVIDGNPDHLLEVRFEWEGGQPEFNELATFWQDVEEPSEELDFTAFDQAVELGQAINPELFTPETYQLLIDALSVNRDTLTSQEEIDSSAQAIREAINGLRPVTSHGVGETVEVPAAVVIPFETIFIEDDTLEVGRERIVVEGRKGISIKGKVELNPITQIIARGTKVALDFTALDKAIEFGNDIEKEAYTPATYQVLINALTIDRNSLTSQDAINNATKAIQDAITGLKPVTSHGNPETNPSLPAAEVIPFDTIRVENNQLEKGKERVVQQGRKGIKINGELVLEPIDEIIEVGTLEVNVDSTVTTKIETSKASINSRTTTLPATGEESHPIFSVAALSILVSLGLIVGSKQKENE